MTDNFKKNPFGRSAGLHRQTSEWAKPTWSLPLRKKQMKGWFEDDPRAEEYDKHGTVRLVYSPSKLTRNVLDEMGEMNSSLKYDSYTSSGNKTRRVPKNKLLRRRPLNRVERLRP